MCSEFNVRTTPAQVEAALGIPVRNLSGQTAWDSVIKFSARAPVVEYQTDDGQLTFSEKVFPVSPFPNSRLSGFERQTDGSDSNGQSGNRDDEEDRQIKRIYSMPRWGKPFTERPYLIPMTSFTEYAYWGEEAGSALRFSLPDQELFFAAGIGIKPYIPKTGAENGFSILTHTATPQMLKYHQRLIVLLTPENAAKYLDDMTPDERFRFLIQHRYNGHLDRAKIRNMAKGWEKRIPVQTAKLHRETDYVAALKAESVEG